MPRAIPSLSERNGTVPLEALAISEITGLMKLLLEIGICFVWAPNADIAPAKSNAEEKIPQTRQNNCQEVRKIYVHLQPVDLDI